MRDSMAINSSFASFWVSLTRGITLRSHLSGIRASTRLPITVPTATPSVATPIHIAMPARSRACLNR
jgi:hypothetical protein